MKTFVIRLEAEGIEAHDLGLQTSFPKEVKKIITVAEAEPVEDHLFGDFHSIYWLINETRPKKNKLLILDKEIGDAIQRFLKTN